MPHGVPDEPSTQNTVWADGAAALFERLGAECYRFARGIGAGDADAQDAVQQVFLGLVADSRGFDGLAHARSFCLAATRNRVIDMLRRRDVQARHAADAGSAWLERRAGASVPKGFDAERVENALAALPAHLREVVVLKVFHDMTFAELARVLDLNANTAAWRYREALGALRGTLGVAE